MATGLFSVRSFSAYREGDRSLLGEQDLSTVDKIWGDMGGWVLVELEIERLRCCGISKNLRCCDDKALCID